MSPVDDFFRIRLDQMIDNRHPLVILASFMPRLEIEPSLTHQFGRQVKAGKWVILPFLRVDLSWDFQTKRN
jgi:hypothetical protein